ncbi:MAG: hypothetical protein U0228_14020 [Myxococcaceae bacterium]
MRVALAALALALAACPAPPPPPPADGCLDAPSACLNPSPCLPNPCTDPAERCIAPEGVASCVCAEGVARTDGGCADAPSWACARHGGDDFEPNDCPLDARLLGPETISLFGTLDPAGDRDWFRVARPSTLQLHNEGSDAVLVAGFDDADGFVMRRERLLHKGEHALFGPVQLLRLRSPGANTVWGLGITTREDDFPNTSDGAPWLSPGVVHGSIDYDEDFDVLELVGPAGHALQLTTTERAALVESTGAPVPITRLTVRLPEGERAFVVMTATSSAPMEAPQAWTVAVTDLGVDDHSDEPSYATRFDGADFSGRFERTDDFDALAPQGLAVDHFFAAVSNAACSRLDVVTGGFTACADGWAAVHPSVLVLSPALGAVDRWSVHLEDLGVDDHGDTRNPTGVALDSSFGGEIQAPSDTDVFVFGVPANHAVAVTIAGDVEAVLTDTLGQPHPLPLFTSLRNDHYTLTVRANTRQRYLVQLSDLGVDDVPNLPSLAMPLGGDFAGTLFPGDDDVFQLSLPPATISRVTCRNANQGFCSLEVLSGTTRRAPEPFGFVAGDNAPPIVFVVHGTAFSTYDLTVDVLGPDDWPDSTAQATPISSLDGGLINGTIEWVGDVDAFALGTLDAGDVVSIETTPVGVNVISAFGAPLSGGVATATGPHYALIFSSVPTTYTTRIENLGPDDYPNTGDVARTGPVVTGTFQGFADRDRFSFTLPVGHRLDWTFDHCATVLQNGAAVTPPVVLTVNPLVVEMHPCTAAERRDAWTFTVTDLGP